jgi:phage terminase large subunit
MTTPKKVKNTRISLLPFQAEFVNDINSRYIALVGGLGTGKTKAAVFKTLKLLQENRGCNAIGCEPTGPQLDIFTEQMNETCRQYGIKFRYTGMGAGHPAYYKFDFGFGEQMLRLVSAKNYKSSLVGYNAAFGFIDEFDTIEDKEEGKRIWQALNDRLRHPNASVIQTFVTSTPEGYHLIYDIFAEDCVDGLVTKARPGHRVIQVATTENIYLPEGYVEQQLQRYTPEQAKAKIYGRFVNVYGTRVYSCFDRTVNGTKLTLNDFSKNAILHIGMDFNVGAMSATVSVVQDGVVYTVEEITDEENTDSMIARIKAQYPGRVVYVYPDSSGKNRTANADVASITKLKLAGFQCFYSGNNPSIMKERVPAVNAMFRNANAEVRSYVNIERCPLLVKGLEQQGYKDGKPDKSGGLDHCLDAFGYFMHYRFPVKGKGSLSVVR